MIIKKTGGADFAPPREGVHIAVCTRLIDMGTQETMWKGKPKQSRKVLIGWELPEEDLVEVEGEMLPQIVQARFTASLAERAELRGLLVSWRGRNFTPEEEAGFDMRKVLGAGCQLQLVHSEDGRYANVQGIMPLPKGLPKPQARGPMVHLDLDPENFDRKVFEGLSDKLKELIAATPEFKIATGKALPQQSGAPGDDIPFDDEIPF